MTVPPRLRRSAPTLAAERTVFAVDPLTRMVAESIADEVLTELSWVLSTERPDSELSLLLSLSSDHTLAAQVSPTLSAILQAAQRAQAVSSGWYRPIRLSRELTGGEVVELDTRTRRLTLPRGTELDLWDIGCAWAADRIMERVQDADPFASLAIVVGSSVSAVGAAWEISEALDEDYTVLDPALQRGARAFALLSDQTRTAGAEVWDGVAVSADGAVEALAFAGSAEELGRMAPEWIETVGAQAELRPSRPGRIFGRRRVRTDRWAAKGL